MDLRREKHEGHRERLRQRVLSSSIENLEPHELIEFLLYYVIPRQDVNELSHDLLDRFGSLRSVFNADMEELMKVKGLGIHAAQWLRLVGECIFSCGQLLPEDWIVLTNIRDVTGCLRQIRPEITPPCVVQLCMNRTNRLLHRSIISSTSDWSSPSAIRSAVSDVFSSHAANVMLLVFTGKEDPVPASGDIENAMKYSRMLKYAGCILLDVMLVSEDRLCSMRRLGLVPEPEDPQGMPAVHEDYMFDLSPSESFLTY